MAEKRSNLIFTISFEQPAEAVQPIAYAFDSAGALIDSAPVREGKTELKIDENQARKARILIAPAPPEGAAREKPTLESLERRAAYEPVFQYKPDVREYVLQPVPSVISRYWPWCYCRVRGRVVRPVVSHGSVHDMPVCHARVRICEVDRLFFVLPRIPDRLIDRLRWELIELIRRPFPPPPPPEEFVWDPGFVDPSPENAARMQIKGAAPAAMPEPAGLGAMPAAELTQRSGPPVHHHMAGGAAQSTAHDAGAPAQQAAPRAALSANVLVELSSPSMAAVRESLLNNIGILRNYFCYIPWLRGILTCEEIAVVFTDQYGRFDITVPYLCFGDHPDLYFRVDYSLNGVWTTVYNPGIHCHTYWNFACGSEVTIRVTDPRVPWCGTPDLPGKVVSVVSVGNNVSISEIERSTAGASEGLTTAGEPFGGVLEPHVFFGQIDLAAAGITHYRWSYRKGTGGAWKRMTRKVVRHYGMMIGSNLHFLPLLLGPDPAFPGHDMFKIPPVAPPPGSLGWAPIDAREDSATAFFESHLENGGNAALAAGNYELRLELFKASAPGVPVNLTAEGVTLHIPTVPAPFGPGVVPTRIVPVDPVAVPAMPDRVFTSGADVVAFRMVIHVDNNVCEGAIYPVSGPGLVVDAACGFIQYPLNSNATISFRAHHPNGFARFDFDTNRGNAINVPAASAAGGVHDPAVNGFVRNAPTSVFSKDVPIGPGAGTLLGQTCTKAAFAETLQVDATATDGWRRLSHLDGDQPASAFALEPL